MNVLSPYHMYIGCFENKERACMLPCKLCVQGKELRWISVCLAISAGQRYSLFVGCDQCFDFVRRTTDGLSRNSNWNFCMIEYLLYRRLHIETYISVNSC